MSFYEDLLSRGQHLYQDDRYALYRYLLISNQARYEEQVSKLVEGGSITSSVANGEILYIYSHGRLSYSARKKGEENLQEEVRHIQVNSLPQIRLKKMKNFFAQAEVDVIWNYPIPGIYEQEPASFSITSYPYYDLNYFSNGEGKFKGFLRKMKLEDNPTLQRLLAS